jgi:hypothetical protein
LPSQRTGNPAIVSRKVSALILGPLIPLKADTPHILLVNPWVYDFAAYDFWAKPLGLLTLAAIIRQHGFAVSYLDCLDRFHPNAPATDPAARHGRGPYIKTRLKKPKGLDDVPRNFSRYGIKIEWFYQDLLELSKPDLILVSSLMTYWYPGVQKAIQVIKSVFPDIPVILGGIYATLCQRHAASFSGADQIVSGPGENRILRIISEHTVFTVKRKFDPGDMDTYPYPAFDLQHNVNYVVLLTSKGCPFRCAYCASHFLHPTRMLRSPDAVVEEIQNWQKKYGVRDFVFYDDALLVNAEQHAVPMLEAIVKAGLNVHFHTPNAIHVRGINRRTAELMYRAGFKTVRLGLETTAFGQRGELDAKVTADEFVQAVTVLKKAGFGREEVGAYLLTGLPGQTMDSITASIETVKQSGITPVPAYYSPIPHTGLWEEAVRSSRYDLESDPIYTNNAIFPCQPGGFSWESLSILKDLVADRS